MRFLLLYLFIFFFSSSWSQSPPQPFTSAYPQVKGYGSIVHPIITVDQTGSTWNFSHGYAVGFPFGLNLLKSDKIGFSFEFTPTVRAENGSSRMSSLLFHPGVMFRRPNGFTFISRLAFETNGRYGFTPVFNKILVRRKDFSYFLAMPLPVRFGNDKPASIAVGLQVGIVF